MFTVTFGTRWLLSADMTSVVKVLIMEKMGLSSLIKAAKANRVSVMLNSLNK